MGKRASELHLDNPDTLLRATAKSPKFAPQLHAMAGFRSAFARCTLSAATILAISLLVSCSSEQVAQTSETSIGAAGSAGEAERIAVISAALPLELLLVPSETDYPLLDAAVNQLTAQCMNERGYDYEPYPGRPPVRLLDLRIRYAALTRNEAAQSGYRATVPAGAPADYLAEVDRIDNERDAAGADYLGALYGPNGDGGCRGDASMTVWGGPTGLMSVPGYQDIVQLSVEAFGLLEAAPDVKTTNRAWSDCMTGRGYRFENWTQAPKKFLLPDTSVSPQEIDQATADVQCREDVGLEKVLFAAESRIQADLIDKSPLIDDFTARIKAAVIRAKELDPGS